MSASVVAVCISPRKGMRKTAVPAVELWEEHGIVGDAHAGPGHRQVSLLAQESIDKMRQLGVDVGLGGFAENLTTQGLELFTLPLGTRIAVGATLLEVSQIGKECHTRRAIYHQAGDCIMPKAGIFARVLQGGTIKSGDPVEIVEAAIPKRCGQ